MFLFLHCSPIILILLVYMTTCFTQEPTGPNVCYYLVTLNVTKEKVTITNSLDCPAGQKVCQVNTFEVVYETRTEYVKKCCKGWIRTGNNCSQPCADNTFGLNCSETCNCTSVNTFCEPVIGCTCMDGWKEPNCSSPCDPGSYGVGCSKTCTCLNGASCDPINGSCNCTPGWMGSDCNITCPAGRYGNDCQENCTCLEGAVCDPMNGSCSCLPDTTGPNCTFLEESTTHQTKVMQGNVPLVRDRIDSQKVIIVAISCVSFAVGITIGFIICSLYKRYKNSNYIRASSTSHTDDQRNDGCGGATQVGLQTPESGAMLISTEIPQKPGCTTSTENADVMHMYETSILSDDRTRYPLGEAPSCVSHRHEEGPHDTTLRCAVVPDTSLSEGESAYCDVEVNTPQQVKAVYNTHSGEIEHTYYQRNANL